MSYANTSAIRSETVAVHKEVFVANGPLNRVFTFYFPEMFD